MRWYLFRAVEYYPFDVWSIGVGYVRGKNRALRWRFKNILFYFDGNVEYSLRSVRDLEDLRKFLRRNLNAAFARRVGREIRNAARDLVVITKKAFRNKISLAKHFDEFLHAHQRFLAVFQTPELAQYLVPEKDKKLLRRFGMDRDYAARHLATIEDVSRSGLARITKLPWSTALMLLPREVREWLATGTLPKDLRTRKLFALLLTDGKEKIFWNADAKRLFNREYKQHLSAPPKGEVSGTTAYPGQARGRVYRAMSDGDVAKMPRGAILVCSMTRYTIAHHLPRAAAIVTDQGGMTCHAAVIARELKIPTVMGTNRATDMFKTGDRVKVDADKGVVRKL